MKTRWSVRTSGVATLTSLLFAGALGCSRDVPIGALPDGGASEPDAQCAPSTPSTVASADSGITNLALQGNTLYWTNGPDLRKVSLAGGPSFLVGAGVIADPSNAYLLAADATTFYYSDFLSVRKVPLGGDPPTVLLTSQHTIGAIAVDAENIYWTEWIGEYDGRVMKMPLTGGAATVLAPGPAAQATLALDDDHVYWTHRTDGKTVKSGTVMKVPKAGGAAVVIASGEVTPSNIVVDADSVYWSALAAHAVIKKAPKGGGEASVIATFTSTGRDPVFVVNGTSLYWFEDDTSESLSLRKGSIDGDPPTSISIPGPAMELTSGPIACPGGLCWVGGVIGDNAGKPIEAGSLPVRVMRYNACP